MFSAVREADHSFFPLGASTLFFNRGNEGCGLVYPTHVLLPRITPKQLAKKRKGVFTKKKCRGKVSRNINAVNKSIKRFSLLFVGSAIAKSSSVDRISPLCVLVSLPTILLLPHAWYRNFSCVCRFSVSSIMRL